MGYPGYYNYQPPPPSLAEKVAKRAGRGVNAAVDESGHTLLHLAILKGDEVAVERLIKAGANIGQQDGYGHNAMFHAVFAGRAEMVSLLAKHGATFDGLDDDGRPQLLYALESKPSVQTLDALRRAGLPLTQTQTAKQGGKGLGHAAAQADRADILDYLALVNPALLGAADAEGRTPLHAAVAAKAYASMEKLLAPTGPDPLRATKKGRTALHLAAEAGDLRALDLLLAVPDIRHRVDEFRTQDEGQTPLMTAVEKGHVGAAKRLIDVGADPNERDLKNRHSLFIAVEKNNVAMAAMLAENGADVVKAPVLADANLNVNGKTLMHVAGGPAVRALIGILRGAGMPVDVQDGLGQTALLRAAEARDATKVKCLLEEKADPDAAALSGRRPIDALMAAAANSGNVSDLRDTLAALLAAKADPNIANDSRVLSAPLHFAARLRYPDLTRALVEAGARVDERERSTGLTPWLSALLAGSKSAADYLRGKGADVTLVDNAKRGALHLAAMSEDETILPPLLREKQFAALIDQPDASGLTPAHHAVLQRRPGSLRALIAAGAETGLLDSKGFAPLHYAITVSNPDAVSALETSGPGGRKTDWNIRTRDTKETPLHLAARNGHYMVLERLLRNPVSLTAQDARGYTPIMTAVERSQYGAIRSIAERMKRSGIALDAVRDPDGLGPLHVAAQSDYATSFLSMLLENGASLGARTRKGDTPLHIALAKGNYAVARLLVARGAPLNVRNDAGQLPFDIAKAKGNAEIIALVMPPSPPPAPKPAVENKPKPSRRRWPGLGGATLALALLVLPAAARAETVVVTSVDKCFSQLDAAEVLDIKRNNPHPYTECERRVAEKNKSKKPDKSAKKEDKDPKKSEETKDPEKKD